MSRPASGFARALSALTEAGVEFVVVGVGGINFYARTPAHAFSTLDLDALVSPTVDNLTSALRTLSALGYEFEAGAEPFLDLEDPDILARVVAQGASLSALHPDAGQLDVMTSIAGFSYDEMAGAAVPFSVAGTEIQVGRLEMLLRAKQSSGRPKDLEFLRAFDAQATAGDDEEP